LAPLREAHTYTDRPHMDFSMPREQISAGGEGGHQRTFPGRRGSHHGGAADRRACQHQLGAQQRRPRGPHRQTHPGDTASPPLSKARRCHTSQDCQSSLLPESVASKGGCKSFGRLGLRIHCRYARIVVLWESPMTTRYARIVVIGHTIGNRGLSMGGGLSRGTILPPPPPPDIASTCSLYRRRFSLLINFSIHAGAIAGGGVGHGQAHGCCHHAAARHRHREQVCQHGLCQGDLREPALPLSPFDSPPPRQCKWLLYCDLPVGAATCLTFFMGYCVIKFPTHLCFCRMQRRGNTIICQMLQTRPLRKQPLQQWRRRNPHSLSI